MINHLQIKNFKGWKDTGRLRLAPITIFFGTNSSGKSSIGQFLMMLTQTAASHDRSRVLHPGDKNTPVDLGTIEDLVYKHDLKNSLSFSFGATESSAIKITDALTEETYEGNQLNFDCQIRFENDKAPRAHCSHFKYTLGNEATDDLCSIELKEESEASGKYKLKTTAFNAVRKPGRAWPLPSPARFFGFPDELTAHYQNTSDFEELSLRLKRMFGQISYLGPLRAKPERFYAWAGENPENVGTQGERWVSALLAASDRKINAGYNMKRHSFEKIIAEWLKKLGLIHSFVIQPLSKGSREYRVKVRMTEGAPEVSIPDVGFGVSQMLPVIVQSFYAPQNSTVIIEQPELHLHPAIQQNLADLFIGAACAREAGEDRNVQFLIESHSEHFLRRLQRRIAEGAVQQEDVAIYFCDQTPQGSRATPLHLDAGGNITNWPKDFFGDQMTDIAEMQKAGIQKRREANS